MANEGAMHVMDAEEAEVADVLRRHLLALFRIFDRSWERRYYFTIVVQRKPGQPPSTFLAAVTDVTDAR